MGNSNPSPRTETQPQSEYEPTILPLKSRNTQMSKDDAIKLKTAQAVTLIPDPDPEYSNIYSPVTIYHNKNIGSSRYSRQRDHLYIPIANPNLRGTYQYYDPEIVDIQLRCNNLLSDPDSNIFLAVNRGQEAFYDNKFCAAHHLLLRLHTNVDPQNKELTDRLSININRFKAQTHNALHQIIRYTQPEISDDYIESIRYIDLYWHFLCNQTITTLEGLDIFPILNDFVLRNGEIAPEIAEFRQAEDILDESLCDVGRALGIDVFIFRRGLQSNGTAVTLLDTRLEPPLFRVVNSP